MTGECVGRWAQFHLHGAGLLLAVCAVVAGSAASSRAAEIGESDVLGKSEAEEVVEAIKMASSEAEEALEEMSSDRLGAELALEAADYDPEQIVGWVASATRWAPYPGALRGPAGVLMDRVGSSLDLSLFLAELLADAGLDVRLARTTLSEEQVSRLFRQERGSPAVPLAADGYRLGSQAEIEQARARVSEQAQALAEMVGAPPRGRDPAEDPAQVKAAADHWWVQTRDGATWEDHDFVYQGEARGELRAEAFFDPDELPDSLFQKLTIRVVAQASEGGRSTEFTPLAHTIEPAKAPPAQQIEISFSAFMRPGNEDVEAEPQDPLLDLAIGATHWSPKLEIGHETIVGEWFSVEGLVETPPILATAEKLAEASNRLSQLGTEAQEAASQSQLTALWLEYEIERPGEEPVVARREIFDLSATTGEQQPAALDIESTGRRDRGLSLLGTTYALVLNSAPHGDALKRDLLRMWVENRNSLIALVLLASGSDDERIPLALSQTDYRVVDLVAMSIARGSWSPDRSSRYLDRPNVWTSHLLYRPAGPAGRHVETSFATDIVFNTDSLLLGVDRDPWTARLEQGVLDTLIEHELATDPGPLNTFVQFASRVREKTDWVVVQKASQLDELPTLPAADRRRIEAAIGEGDLAVVSSKPLTFGDEDFAVWWRVNPVDGTTLGMGYKGWGANLPEKVGVHIIPEAVAQRAAQLQGRKVACNFSAAYVALVARLAAREAAAKGIKVEPLVKRGIEKACFVLK